jgi:hypothetical protein
MIGFETKKMIESAYLRNHIWYFLLKNNLGIPGEDYKTHIMTLVFEYSIGLFSLPQLYCMFMAVKHNGKYWSFNKSNRLKIDVLIYIDQVATKEHQLGNIENFKRKIMELNPVVFNVLNDLLCSSQIFWDDKRKEFRYPQILE